jgi:hypothetical protein
LSILHFGFLDNCRLSCEKIDLLICFFNQLHPSFNDVNDESYEVKVLSANKDFMLSDVKNSFSQTGKVSPKNLRVGNLISVTFRDWNIWLSLCAFQCLASRLRHSPGNSTYRSSYKACKGSYSITKCSTVNCDQPYYLCEVCKVNCYDCNKGGLCSECIHETPNSGEIVFVCAPCRGFCISKGY